MKKILLIDDELDILEILKEFLEFRGFNVIHFDNPVKAIKNFHPDYYNIVITDLNLPDMSGCELVSKIREIDRNIPIIIISGYLEDIQKENILTKGASAYLEKPFNLKQLENLIEKSLQGVQSCNIQPAEKL
jgi:DNA-binding response OmpR family regulator